MSGHSKWSTIKHKKAANDQARGKVFSKLSKAITVAVKTGGGDNPDFNNKLRVAIDAAKKENMPNANIERAISNAASSTEQMEEVTYEGFGPGGIGVIVDAVTDNRNRTSQEIKLLFDRGGGTFAKPGAVSFNFTPKGYLLVEMKGDPEEEQLVLIDAGVEDMEETDEGIEAYVEPTKLYEVKKAVEESGFTVIDAELIQKPNTSLLLKSAEGQKAVSFLERIDDHDDVQKIYSNLELTD